MIAREPRRVHDRGRAMRDSGGRSPGDPGHHEAPRAGAPAYPLAVSGRRRDWDRIAAR